MTSSSRPKTAVRWGIALVLAPVVLGIAVLVCIQSGCLVGEKTEIGEALFDVFEPAGIVKKIRSLGGGNGN